MTIELPYISAWQAEKKGFESPPCRDSPFKKGANSFPRFKTGTTIVGIVCADCVILGADTRSTAGNIVGDKECSKLHYIADNIWGAGAGISADLDHITDGLRADLKLFAKQTGRQLRVQTCVTRLVQHLFQYNGEIVTALIIGGVEPTGRLALYEVDPDGTSVSRPFMSMGSGGYFAISMLETLYRPNFTEAEGIDVVVKAVESGIVNDLGSGSYVDLVVIRRNDPNHPVKMRKLKYPALQDIQPAEGPVTFPSGTTRILKETRTPIRPFRPYQNA